jgi:hypothetical protein
MIRRALTAVWAAWLGTAAAFVLFLACTPRGPSINYADRCGAVMVGPHVALTAGHCARGGPEVLAVDKARDLALITARAQHYNGHVRPAVVGEVVIACSALYDKCVTGAVTHRNHIGYLETNLTVVPGWSGSPVVGLDGALVGIVTACMGSEIWAGLTKKKTCVPGFAFVAEAMPLADD